MRSLIGLVMVLAAAGTLYASPSVVASLDAVKTESGSTISADADAMQQRVAMHDERARHLQIAARFEKDSIKLGCVSHGAGVLARLNEVEQDHILSLKAALVSRDHELVAEQFRQISMVAGEAERTGQDVEACIGSKQVALLDDPTTVNSLGSDAVVTDAEQKKPRKKPLRATNNCSDVGVAGCQSVPLEYVGFASPFLPD